MFLFRYETSSDDKTTLLINVQVDATNLPLKLVVEGLLKANGHSMYSMLPGLYQEHDIKASYNVSPSDGTIDVSVEFNETKVMLSLKKSNSDASFELTSNVAGFSSLKGKVNWVSRGNRTKYDFVFEMNGQKMMHGEFGHDSNPFSR